MKRFGQNSLVYLKRHEIVYWSSKELTVAEALEYIIEALPEFGL